MIDWLGDPVNAFVACITTNVWLGFPFMMVIALGGMQGIPQELYEAARIDRVSRWMQFWHITLPMLMPVLLPAITLGTVWTFNNLNVIWLVSNGGEPSDQTHILVSYVYKAVFNQYRYGYGAALSMVIFVILLVFSVCFCGGPRRPKGVHNGMKEPLLDHRRLGTRCLLLFVAISVYPVLNVFSISLRPGDRLRSQDLAIIPEDWTFDSYVAAIHRATVSALGRQLAVGGGRW